MHTRQADAGELRRRLRLSRRFVRSKQASTSGSRTRYITLNFGHVGAIEGSESILAMLAKQLEQWRKVTRLMSFDEFYMVMEHSMSPKSRGAQNVMGFDRQTLVAAQDELGLANPLLAMLPYSEQ